LKWLAPENLGNGINGAVHDTGPSYLEADGWRGARIYFARGAGSPTMDIWVSEQMGDGAWGPAVPVVELNTDFHDAGQKSATTGSRSSFIQIAPVDFSCGPRLGKRQLNPSWPR
jgi:hypothetical protein